MPQIDVPDQPLADGSVSTIIQLKEWTDNAIICWGGLSLGGRVTVHLVNKLEQFRGQVGGYAACMSNWGPNILWTIEYGFKDWPGAKLCKNCFSLPGNGLWGPKAKKMPVGGWYTYGVKPKIEEEEDKNTVIATQLLSPLSPITIPPGPALLAPDGKRIVEL